MKTILCYGDSLLWGFIPGSYNAQTCLGKRYPKNKRSTGILQNLLGNQCYIIEETLNGRTTSLDEIIPGRANRNGLSQFPVCLESHYPIDLIVLMLGTNDMKIQYKQSIENSAENVRRLIKIAKTGNKGPDGNAPKILLLAPPVLVKSINMQDQYDEISINKSTALGGAYKEIAHQEHCTYLDVSKIVISSDIDGVHLDEKQHELLGHALAKEIAEILNFTFSIRA